MFQYLESYALHEKAKIFLTTHSSTALDFFGTSENAQIIHVTHDGKTASATTVAAHFDHLEVVSTLGARPSDILQANGIVWVEGPSDRIYLNRWIQLFSDGVLQEGRHYQCAFYGGSLLARTQFKPREEADPNLANLFRVNPNIVVVCDGDRSTKHSPFKERVKRIRAEVQEIPDAHIWITCATEIENYIPGSVLEKACGLPSARDPNKFENFFPRKRSRRMSYVEETMKRNDVDKMRLAIMSAPYMTKNAMATRFDWEHQMRIVVGRINSWNDREQGGRREREA